MSVVLTACVDEVDERACACVDGVDERACACVDEVDERACVCVDGVDERERACVDGVDERECACVSVVLTGEVKASLCKELFWSLDSTSNLNCFKKDSSIVEYLTFSMVF